MPRDQHASRFARRRIGVVCSLSRALSDDIDAYKLLVEDQNPGLVDAHHMRSQASCESPANKWKWVSAKTPVSSSTLANSVVDDRLMIFPLSPKTSPIALQLLSTRQQIEE